jgi:hypothetical protein
MVRSKNPCSSFPTLAGENPHLLKKAGLRMMDAVVMPEKAESN